MDKPTKPTDLVPRSFGGVKNNFSSSLQSSGYEDGIPAIYGGDNLNYQLDATGKELDYCEKICDFINNIPIGKTVTVDANNKLVYDDLIHEPPIATTENLGVVKPDGETIVVDENGVISSTIGSDYANQDINNLTQLGNARLQYAPFAINDGVVNENGENATLTYPEGGESYEVEVTGKLPNLSGNNVTRTVTHTFDSAKKLKSFTATYRLNPSYYSSCSVSVVATLSDNTTITLATYTQAGYADKTYSNVTYTFATPTLVKSIKFTGNTSNGSWQIKNSSYVELVQYASSDTVICNACTLTTCDGRTFVDNDSKELDVSEVADGSYYVFKDAETGELSLSDDFYIGKSGSNDYFLNTSKIPATMYVNGEVDNNKVYIGDVTVASGLVTALTNRVLNDSGYIVQRQYAFMPDYSAGVSVTATQAINLNYDALLVWYKSSGAASTTSIAVYKGTNSSGLLICSGGQSSNAGGGYYNLTLPLCKNEDYYIEFNGSAFICKYYPLKGGI